MVSVHRVSLKACSWQTCVCSLDAQVQFFRQNGFVCLTNVFSGNQLRRMQTAWCRALARADTEMANRTDEGHMVALEELFAEALPPPLRPAASKSRVDCSCSAEKDPVLLDALDAPPVVRLLEAIIGPGRFTSDDVALAGVQACAAVKGQSVQDGQRVWGRFGASGPANGWPHPSHRVIQVVISLSDDEGPIVVPGSHRVSLDPEHIYYNRATMPNQVEVRSKAGFACLCDAAIWKQKARSDKNSFIIGYHSQRANIPTGPKPANALIEQLDAAGVLRDSLRGLFAIE